MGLAKNANNSIITIRGISHQGVPLGKNILKKPIFCFAKPAKIATRNTIRARTNVTIIWLVIVKLKGKRPITFPNSTSRKIVKTKSK
ncbi:hypothetical protein RLOatenuis_8660 [Rickettsiales bacterium]|nr:hypothetical protein RLOatenuis_8660 [Rickettsiales bacterium]